MREIWARQALVLQRLEGFERWVRERMDKVETILNALVSKAVQQWLVMIHLVDRVFSVRDGDGPHHNQISLVQSPPG